MTKKIKNLNYDRLEYDSSLPELGSSLGFSKKRDKKKLSKWRTVKSPSTSMRSREYQTGFY